jgi:tetratricopeptide (TPR) repeat protein
MHVGQNVAMLASVCTLALGGCANVTDTLRVLTGSAVEFVEPMDQAEMSGYRNIRIQAGQKNRGAEAAMASAMQAALAGKLVNGATYYQQVSVGNDPSAPRDESWALLKVTVSQAEVVNNQGQEERVDCPKKKLVCKRSEAERIYMVNCRTRTATVAANVAGFNARSNAALFSTDKRDSVQSKVCYGDNATLASEESVLKEALDNVTTQFVTGITPKLTKRPNDLVEEEKSLSASDNAKLKQAYRFAATGSPGEAIRMYEEMIQGGQNNGAVLFNAGFVEHARGNFAKAQAYYQRASMQPGAPQVLTRYMAEATAWVSRGMTVAVR